MVAVLLVLGGAIYAVVARSLEATSLDQLEHRVASIERFVSGVPDPFPDRPAGEAPVGISFGGPAPGTIALIITPSGQTIGPSTRLAGLPIGDAVKAALGGATDIRTAVVADVPIRVLTVPVQRANGTVVLQVIQDISAERRTLDTVLVVLVVGGLAGIAAAGVGGWFYARRALVPIRDALRRQREFAADASHEIRTPLAVIRATVEHLERHPERTLGSEADALDDMKAEVDHLTALVGDLLLLARTDSGVEELSAEPTDLERIASEAIEGLRTVAAERSVALDLAAVPTPLTGDPLRLRQLVTILVDNAIRHGPAGSTVRVGVHPDDRGGGTLTVDDEGTGIAAEDRARVFDRFWRAPGTSTGGTGLGLAIAHWVVQRQGGSISVGDAPNGGARFEIHLPGHPA